MQYRTVRPARAHLLVRMHAHDSMCQIQELTG